MKPTRVLIFPFSVLCVMLLLLLFSDTASAVPTVPYNAGRYSGTLKVTTSLDDFVTTKTTLKIKGRSTGTTTLNFLAPPVPALGVFSAGDDNPIKFFRFEAVFGPDGPVAGLTEVISCDAEAGPVGTFSRSLDTLVVEGKTITAQCSYVRTIFGADCTITINIELTRLGL